MGSEATPHSLGRNDRLIWEPLSFRFQPGNISDLRSCLLESGSKRIRLNPYPAFRSSSRLISTDAPQLGVSGNSIALLLIGGCSLRLMGTCTTAGCRSRCRNCRDVIRSEGQFWIGPTIRFPASLSSPARCPSRARGRWCRLVLVCSAGGPGEKEESLICFGWRYVSSAGFPTPTSLASAARSLS